MSVYASIPGIGGDGDDETIGAPWVYRGSHKIPRVDDPRGGEVGMAVIPSFITRDGRDDGPEGAAPWPWLRLDVVPANEDNTVLINPAQARHIGQQLIDWAAEAETSPHATEDTL